MDVFVIGGGPAGLAAAIAARNEGFRVTVADGAMPPIEKACGEGLMPDTLDALRELGIHLTDFDGFAYRGIRFIEGGCDIEARFTALHGMGVRRRVLHQKMIERAAECGIQLRWETPVVSLHEGAVTLANGETISPKWIIGADGSGSRVRKWVGLDTAKMKSRFAYRRHFRIRPWTDCVEVYWDNACQAYVTPVSAEQICLTIMSEDSNARLEQQLPRFPEIWERLRTAEPASVERGGVTATLRLNSVHNGNVALIGDASGGVDAITGEGLSLAFRQASVLARALVANDLNIYEAAHRRIARRPALMARGMLLLGRNAALRRRVLRTFASEPKVFSDFVSYHVGLKSSIQFAALTAKFGWRLASA